jgi:transposase
MMTTTDAKSAVLRQQGVLHPHPERIVDSRFRDHDFFDPRDLVQVQYEMLRRVRVEGASVMAVVAAFGYSRFAFYEAKDAYQRGGLPGLVRRRPGPRHRHKLNGPILAFLLEQRGRDPASAAEALTRLVRDRFGVSVHPRSIERVLDHPQKRGRSTRPQRPTLPDCGRLGTKIFASER